MIGLISAVLPSVMEVAGRFLPEDAEERAKAERAIKAQLTEHLAKVDLAQIEVNKEEAKGNWFQSSWRPLTGWTCAASLAWTYLLQPMVSFALAQTGHLVLSTVHTIDAMQTVTRIVDIFPPHQQNQIRLQLADSLCSVISQRLLPRKDKPGMVPAVEVLFANALIRSLIEENNFSSISEQMEKGDYYGMQTFNQSLERLCNDGKVDLEEAKKAATNPEDLLLRIRGIKSGSGAKA